MPRLERNNQGTIRSCDFKFKQHAIWPKNIRFGHEIVTPFLRAAWDRCK